MMQWIIAPVPRPLCVMPGTVKLSSGKQPKTGIRVDIIDGQEEAHIVYDNHIEQLFASGQNYLYVDVGGGSTEINLISNGELKNSRSYNIGTVRMLSGMVKEEEKEALRTDLIGIATEYAPVSIIGSGEISTNSSVSRTKG